MGYVRAEIELANANDVQLAKQKQIGEDEVKKMTVRALVDSGSYLLAINENIRNYLQLMPLYKERACLANGNIIECDVVYPVEVKFKNRHACCSAMVLPGDSEVLLGAIPMEEMDVIIDPKRQELVVNPDHPDGAVFRL
jgi:clan AA aspartic protease